MISSEKINHRRTTGGLSTLNWAKQLLFFRQLLNFSGGRQQPKMKQKFDIYPMEKSFHPARWSARNPGLFTECGDSIKAILNKTLLLTIYSFSSLITCHLVRLYKHFSGRCWNIFRAKIAQSTLEKLARMPMNLTYTC